MNKLNAIIVLLTIGLVWLLLIAQAPAATLAVHVIHYQLQAEPVLYELPTACGPVYVEIKVDPI